MFLYLRGAFLISFAPSGQEGKTSIPDFSSRGITTARLSQNSFEDHQL